MKTLTGMGACSQKKFFRVSPLRIASGYQGIHLMRQSFNTEIKFMTMLLLDSWYAVKQFSGEDYETAYVPPKAREVLSRFNARSQYYEILAQLDYYAKTTR